MRAIRQFRKGLFSTLELYNAALVGDRQSNAYTDKQKQHKNLLEYFLPNYFFAPILITFFYEKKCIENSFDKSRFFLANLLFIFLESSVMHLI